MDIIKKAIKEKFPNRKDFAKLIGVKTSSDVNSKIRTISNQLKNSTEFLNKVGKTIEIVDL